MDQLIIVEETEKLPNFMNRRHSESQLKEMDDLYLRMREVNGTISRMNSINRGDGRYLLENKEE